MSQPEASSQSLVLPGVPVLQKGKVVGGKYQIDSLIGAGAMGYVVSANHIELGQAVALKFLRPELLSHPTVVARFATEARAVAKIRSEHVARVYDVGTLDDGAPFIVMELLTGSDLAQVLATGTRIAPDVAVGFILQACEALAIAHACGIVHRDIKPENLFLAKSMQGPDVIKVLDFGISKLALAAAAHVAEAPLVRTMVPLGSPVYMSPEQIRASSDADSRTDIWSLGCVLYELLAGRVAFDAPSITQLCAAILEERAPSLRLVRPDVPGELDAVIARCLEKQRDDRFPDVAELAMALLPFASPASRISVQRCCYVLGKTQPVDDTADGADDRTSRWNTTGSALSLRPATIDRANLIETVAGLDPATTGAPSPRKGFGVVAGSLLTFALALGFWLVRPPVDTKQAAASELSRVAPARAPATDGVVTTSSPPPAVSAVPPVASASASASSAVAPEAGAPSAPAPKSPPKINRAPASPGKRVLRTAEPDVGF